MKLSKIKFLFLAFSFVLLTFPKFSLAVNFIGFEWSSESDDWRPSLVIGVRKNHNENFNPSNKDADVSGWGALFAVGWEGIDRVKIFRLKGISYMQFELGAGYSFTNETPFINAGLQLEILPDVGVDVFRNITADLLFTFDGEKTNYFGFNNTKFKKTGNN